MGIDTLGKRTYNSNERMIQETDQDSRTRLLDAAESLFGQRCLHASIRDITRAGKTNLAAVNYHFGSKEALVAAVLERKAAPVNRERLQRLNELEESGSPVPVEQILRAFAEPTVDLQLHHQNFVRFAGRVVTDPDPKIRQVLASLFGDVARRFHAALCRALPHLEPTEVLLRMGLLLGAMIYTWTNREDLIPLSGEPASFPVEEMVDRVIAFAAAGMRA